MISALFLLPHPEARAQEPSFSEACGTSIPANLAPVLYQRAQNWHASEFRASSAHYEIPVVNHIVRASGGSGGLALNDLAATIDSANVLLAQINVSIFECQPVDFIDNSYYYSYMKTEQRINSLRHEHIVDDAVNIYWVPQSSGFPYCGISSFPGDSVQGLIIRNECSGAGVNNQVLVHEIGHYFDLLHTHETAFGIECPSEVNCDSTGDLLCDTPADPNLLGHVSPPPDCAYDNFAVYGEDCDSTPYSPPVDNIMSYSNGECAVVLTPDQIAKFRFALQALRPELAVIQLNEPTCEQTPAGLGVFVQVGTAVGVTFAHVVAEGETCVSTAVAPPAPPPGYQFVASVPPAYYDISTSAGYDDSIEICFSYDADDLGDIPESNLAVFTFDDGVWEDITTSRDELNNLICGKTDHLSPFGVAYPDYVCGDTDGNKIISISDAVYLVNYIFGGGQPPAPLIAADADCDGSIIITDAVYLINFIFSGGPVPCANCP